MHIRSFQKMVLVLDRLHLFLLGKIRKEQQPPSIALHSPLWQAGGLVPSPLQRFKGHSSTCSTEQSGGATEGEGEKLEELQEGLGEGYQVHVNWQGKKSSNAVGMGWEGNPWTAKGKINSQLCDSNICNRPTITTFLASAVPFKPARCTTASQGISLPLQALGYILSIKVHAKTVLCPIGTTSPTDARKSLALQQ